MALIQDSSDPRRPFGLISGTAACADATMTSRTIMLGGLLGGLLAALSAASAPAKERPRRAQPAPTAEERAERGFDWTGAYAGVTAGAATGGGRVRDGRGDPDRFPPDRTRVRP
jgi:hypothetical protein